MPYGDITVDGRLNDWTESELLYWAGTGLRLYGKLADGAFVFAISGAGPGTTLWINTDQNAATGYTLGGPDPLTGLYNAGSSAPLYIPDPVNTTPFAGGAEYQVEIIYTYAPPHPAYPGLLLVTGTTAIFGQAGTGPIGSLDRAVGPNQVVEFAVPTGLTTGNPQAIDLKIDFSNTTFIPHTFGLTAASPVADEALPYFYQLQGASFTELSALNFRTAVVDMDDSKMSATDVGTLNAHGKQLIAYVSIGQAETLR